MRDWWTSRASLPTRVVVALTGLAVIIALGFVIWSELYRPGTVMGLA
jgi:hypothetical protein